MTNQKIDWVNEINKQLSRHFKESVLNKYRSSYDCLWEKGVSSSEASDYLKEYIEESEDAQRAFWFDLL